VMVNLRGLNLSFIKAKSSWAKIQNANLLFFIEIYYLQMIFLASKIIEWLLFIH
jgi:hypothetical protein